MSRQHKVVSGDTLGKIAVRYYGVWNRWTDIRAANPQLAPRGKAVDGSPQVYPGDSLIIPDEAAAAAPETNNQTPVRMSDTGPGEFAILIDGKTFSAFTTIDLTLSLDSMATFSFASPWDDTVADQKSAFTPFAFRSCALYYRRGLVFSGALLTPNPSVTPSSRSVALQGYPLCGALNDCCLPDTKFPAEYAGKNLQQIAEEVCNPFGVRAKFVDGPGAAFEKVSFDIGGTVLAFLAGLAKDRGLLVTNDREGNLQFWKAKDGQPAAVFKEGELPFVSCTCAFDAQKYYSHITGYTKTKKDAPAQSFTWQNPLLRGVLRPFSFTADDTENGGIEDAVKAYAGRMFGGAVTYKLTVLGHEDADGKLYAPNTIVAVTAPGAMIYRETKLLVKSAAFKQSDSEGDTTTLDLVLPGAYTGQLPEGMPWDE